MRDFFKLYESQNLFCLEVGHSSITDWNLLIYDRRGKALGNWGDPIISIQNCDLEYVFAKAYVELADYCSEHLGGY
jgi:hypothetical protein